MVGRVFVQPERPKQADNKGFRGTNKMDPGEIPESPDNGGDLTAPQEAELITAIVDSVCVFHPFSSAACQISLFVILPRHKGPRGPEV